MHDNAYRELSTIHCRFKLEKRKSIIRFPAVLVFHKKHKFEVEWYFLTFHINKRIVEPTKVLELKLFVQWLSNVMVEILHMKSKAQFII